MALALALDYSNCTVSPLFDKGTAASNRLTIAGVSAT